jgi:LysR family glycine cleavage system transcriptional activator
MRRLPPLSAVRVFEAAARHLNFTAAGDELGMTQAAVSYQIRTLEERLGVSLFRRERKRVLLTEAGRTALPLVSGAFDMLDDAFRRLRTEDEGVLTVSVTPTFASHWLAPRLGRFQVANPAMAVRVRTANTLVDFARDDVDLAIRSGVGPWLGLTHHFLFRMHFAPMCGPSEPPLAAPADLLSRSLLSPHDPWWPLWFRAAGVDAGDIAARPGIRLDSQAEEGAAVMAGHGIALMSPVYWQQELAAGRLVMPFPQLGFAEGNTWLVHPERRANVPKVKRFREWLRAEIATQAAGDSSGAFEQPS